MGALQGRQRRGEGGCQPGRTRRGARPVSANAAVEYKERPKCKLVSNMLPPFQIFQCFDLVFVDLLHVIVAP